VSRKALLASYPVDMVYCDAMHHTSVKCSITIEVESTAGKGTTFNVRIPLQVATVAQKS